MTGLLRRSPAALLIVALVVVTVGLSLGGLVARSRETGGATTAGAELGDRYAQTWPKAYSATTCDEFLNAMSQRQRFAASADLLVGERIKGDNPAMPAEELIAGFEAGLGSQCAAAPEFGVQEAATSWYATQRDRFRR